MRRAAGAVPPVATFAPLVLLLLPSVAAAEGLPACAPGTAATSNGDGTMTVRWARQDAAGSYRVLRAEEGGAFETRAVLPAGREAWHDDATDRGTTYRYVVLAEGGAPADEAALAQAAQACPEATATAPDYVHGVLTALGVAALALTAYVVVRASARA